MPMVFILLKVLTKSARPGKSRAGAIALRTSPVRFILHLTGTLRARWVELAPLNE